MNVHGIQCTPRKYCTITRYKKYPFNTLLILRAAKSAMKWKACQGKLIKSKSLSFALETCWSVLHLRHVCLF